MFPAAELRYGGGTYALIFAESGNIELVKVKTENGLLFYVPKFGVFQINKENRLIFGKSQVYIFDQKQMNSINVQALANITEYGETRHKENPAIKPHFEISEIATVVEAMELEITESSLLHDMQTIGMLPKEQDLYTYLRLISAEELSEEQRMKKAEIKNKFEPSVIAQLEVLHSKALKAIGKTETELRKYLTPDTIRWLNAFYKTDDMAHLNIYQRTFENSRYHMKKSGSVIPWWIWQQTAVAQNIAFVIIDNRLLDIDAAIKLKVLLADDKATIYVVSKKYGTFEVADPKTTYRYGKTRVYVLSVTTKKEYSLETMNKIAATPVSIEVIQRETAP